MCPLYGGRLWFKCSCGTWKKCRLYGVSSLERFCYKGFLRNSSGTKFFVRLREVSALGRFHCTQGGSTVHRNLSIWRCEDARIPTSTYEPEGMRMWGCEDRSKHTQTSEYDIRMWGRDDKIKYTGIWVYVDVRMQRCKQARMNLRI